MINVFLALSSKSVAFSVPSTFQVPRQSNFDVYIENNDKKSITNKSWGEVKSRDGFSSKDPFRELLSNWIYEIKKRNAEDEYGYRISNSKYTDTYSLAILWKIEYMYLWYVENMIQNHIRNIQPCSHFYLFLLSGLPT